MPSFKLLLDCREKELINQLESMGVPIEVNSLDIGDIIVKPDDSTWRTLLIERKTVKDLFSSIKDGRYREQKKRILANYAPKDVFYLIEGSLGYKDNIKQYYGSLVNMALRDNIHIIHTGSVKGTARFIETMAKRYETDAQFLMRDAVEAPEESYVESIKIKKKDNMDPWNCLIIQLSQIPLWSQSKALALLDKHKNMMDILTEITANGIQNIKEIKVKGRRIGDKCADNLVTYLCFEEH